MHFSNCTMEVTHITIAESQPRFGIVEKSIELSLDYIIFGRYISMNFASKKILKSSTSEIHLCFYQTFLDFLGPWVSFRAQKFWTGTW